MERIYVVLFVLVNETVDLVEKSTYQLREFTARIILEPIKLIGYLDTFFAPIARSVADQNRLGKAFLSIFSSIMLAMYLALGIFSILIEPTHS